MMRLALDGTPLLGPRSGVGEVVAGIVPELARRPGIELVAYALTLRGRRDLAAHIPPGTRSATCLYPARLVRRAWLHGERPGIERWTGPVDVVHATNYVGPPTKGREVVSVYDLGFMRSPHHVAADALDYPELLRRAIRRGAWIHTTSDFVRDEVVATFPIPAERVVRVYPGIPPVSGGDPARGRALAGIERYVLAIGTIEPRKNFPTLVRAFDALAARDPDVALVVAGTRGWGADDFDAALAGAHHADRVLTPGYVSADDRADLLAGAAVLAYPSHYEGFGFPPLEAMAAGVPVVATSAGAIPEVVGDAARLVGADDVDALADALLAVLVDDAARAELIARGHARRDSFSWTQTVDELLALYDAVRRVKAVVTGARGFVGRHLTRHLAEQGVEVVPLDVDGTQPVDITDRDVVARRISDESPDVVYHLAARSHVGASWTDGDALTLVNVEGTRAVVDACVAVGVARVLVTGSSEQYGTVSPDAVPIDEHTECRPTSPYGASKVAAETVALDAHREHGLSVVCTRAFNHTGPGQSPAFLVPGLAARIVAAERQGADEITLGNGEPVRDFSDVRDVVRAYALLAASGGAGEVYNVCSGAGVRVGDVAERLAARASRPLRVVTDTELVRPVDVPVLVGDPTKLVTATGWRPTYSFDDTLDAVLATARADVP